MLEALCHETSSFVTLTYSDDAIPHDLSLNPKHIQDWLKRLRKAVSPEKIRYFAVGEYGDQTERPHYHLALFNWVPCLNNSVRLHTHNSCCPACDALMKTWGKGLISNGPLTQETAGYIAGYVVKKMTSKLDARLGGRHPEFARMSTVPGVGKNALWDVASTSLQYDLVQSDVPTALRHGRRVLPLGRYLTHNLRTMVGRDASAPDEVLEARRQEMLPVFQAAITATEGAPTPLRQEIRNAAIKETFYKLNEGKILNMENRYSRNNRKAKL